MFGIGYCVLYPFVEFACICVFCMNLRILFVFVYFVYICVFCMYLYIFVYVVCICENCVYQQVFSEYLFCALITDLPLNGKIQMLRHSTSAE
jgi:hypothetical protein